MDNEAKIHPEMKKSETFLDKLRVRTDDFAKSRLEEVPELDAIVVTFVYAAALGDSVEPAALSYISNDNPVTRARIGTALSKTVTIATRYVASGFYDAVETLKAMDKEFNARRIAVEAIDKQVETAGGGNTNTSGTA